MTTIRTSAMVETNQQSITSIQMDILKTKNYNTCWESIQRLNFI